MVGEIEEVGATFYLVVDECPHVAESLEDGVGGCEDVGAMDGDHWLGICF